MSLAEARVGQCVDYRHLRAGTITRVGRGGIWAEFVTPHGRYPVNGDAAEFRLHVAPGVAIGEFTLRPGDAGKIVITAQTGEGGEFDEAQLAAHLAQFWNRHF